MILSASRRTDIPAYHSEWFLRRLEEGYLVVGNPYNNGDISRLALSPETVDCIAFRTKDPGPMIPHLDRMDGYNYYFSFTINPYGREIETGVPSLRERVETFKELSRCLGPLRMDWRYDPAFLSPKYDLNYHTVAFDWLARELAPYANRCVMGFIEHHSFLPKRTDPHSLRWRNESDIVALAEIFGSIAKKYGLRIETCAEALDLEQYGITHGACLDRSHIEQIVGYRFGKVKEKYLRKHCKCLESIDIGAYNTCAHGCIYCYATSSAPRPACDPTSPSLDPVVAAACLRHPERVKDVDCKSFRARASVEPKLF